MPLAGFSQPDSAPCDAAQQAQAVKAQAQEMMNQLSAITQRITEIESTNTNPSARRESNRVSEEKRMFQNIIAVLDQERCVNCGLCVDLCPEQAISTNSNYTVVIDLSKCTGCGSCINECPNEAISLGTGAPRCFIEREMPVPNKKLISHASDATFAETVLRSELPVLVDFWAPWCGPCHMVAPIFEELAGEYKGRVQFVKVNVDEAQQIASSLDIMGIPTIVLFHRGNAIDRQVGVQPTAILSEMLETALLSRSRPTHAEEHTK